MRADRGAHATQEYFIEGPDWGAESDQRAWRNPYQCANRQPAICRDDGHEEDRHGTEEGHVRGHIQRHRSSWRALPGRSNLIEYFGHEFDGPRQLIAQHRERLIRIETDGRREGAHVRTRIKAGGELFESATVQGLDDARAQPCRAGDVVEGQPKLHPRAVKRVRRHRTRLIVGARAAH